MAVPKRFQGWRFLQDPAAEQEVLAANQAHVVNVYNGDPLLNTIKADLDEEKPFDQQHFDETFLPQLVDRRWLDSLVAKLVSPQHGLETFVPQMKAFEESYFNVLEVFWHKKVSIFLSVVDAEKARLLDAPDEFFNVMGFTTYLCFVSGGPATIRIFEVDGDSVTAVDRRIEGGEVIKVMRQRNSMKFIECESDLVVVVVNFLEGRTFDCHRYNMNSGEMVRRSTHDVEAQRILLYSTVLRSMARPDALALLSAFLKHTEPSVRWHVMREMLAIDGPTAAPFLQELAADDPDPVVRQTAAATLEKHREHLGLAAAG